MNIFEEVCQLVREGPQYSRIYQQQSSKFDLSLFKMQNITCQSMTKLYRNISKKYKDASQQAFESQHHWLENERRLFCWFIVCYTSLKEKEGSFDYKDLVYDDKFWSRLSPVFFHKKSQLLQFQYLNLIRSKKRQPWSELQDQYLKDVINEGHQGRWNEVAKLLYYNSNKTCFRTPKQCRQRWLNHLDSSKKKGDWSVTQDYLIFKYVVDHGKHWSKIVPILNNHRTQHMIKNRFHSLVNKHSKNQNNNIKYTEVILHQLQKMVPQKEHYFQQIQLSQKQEDITPLETIQQHFNLQAMPIIIMNYTNPFIQYEGFFQPFYNFYYWGAISQNNIQSN